MPVSPTYPGIYVEEIPSGVRTIVGVATSITAFVGYTQQGPINQPVRIFNYGDYERTFGGLSRDSEVSYAIRQFYLNGGGEAYVLRLAKDVETASVVLQDNDNNDVLTVEAANPGEWGNNLRLDVDYGTQNPDSTFNLVITQYEQQNGQYVPIESETFRNLSMNSQAGNYARDVVNGSSKLIQLTRPDLIFEAGFSISRDLSENFPTLTSDTTIVTGMLNGTTPLDLVLTAPFPDPGGADPIADLVNAFTTAITTRGLAADLMVTRADGTGADDASGDYIKLVATSTEETSAVRISSAPRNDAASLLGLGLGNNGREFTGARVRRPAMTGTVGSDLAEGLGNNFTGTLNVTVTNTTGTILASTPVSIAPEVPIGPALATELQAQLQIIQNAAVSQATVEMVGTALRIRSSAEDPGASLTISGANAADLGLIGVGVSANVQQFSLGTGDRGTQTGAVLGSDGSPPDAQDFLASPLAKQGLYALEDVDLFNLLVIPETTRMSESAALSVIAAATTFCEKRRAMLLIDPPATATVNDVGAWATSASTSRNAAVFFPYLDIPDPIGDFRPRSMPPSGTVAGIFARTDSQRGVWKAPAGTEAVVQSSVGPTRIITDDENGVLNPLAVNCIRKFPVFNTVLWGARTRRGADVLTDEYKYIPVRRLALFLEESLFRSLKWVVFEPNDEPLWAQIRLNVGAFMQNLFRQGAFQGDTPSKAYLVKCDSETTTQNDINLGIVNVVVGFAPLKPAEFVILKIQQLAGQIEV